MYPNYTDIQAAAERLENQAHQTPVMTSSTVNRMTGAQVFFKCENFQKTGSFKFRGAYNTLVQLTQNERKAGVITFSSGNHAQALALSGQMLGIYLDRRLNTPIFDTEENPRFYRRAEHRLYRLNRRKSVKFRKGQRQSNNYHKARVTYAKKHLKVSRQREEHAKRMTRCVCASNDCIAYEDLNVKGLVRNRRLSKSISDAGWTQFRKWVEYFGWKFGKITIAVPPHYTSQDCPACGVRIKKSLSTRTHICQCGYVEDRDIAASINILKKGLSTAGHSGTLVLDTINASGDLSSWVVGENLLSNDESVNEESPTMRQAQATPTR